MFLFLKNSLKQLFKEKIQFGVYVLLIFLAVLFTSSFGIAATSLRGANNNLKSDFQSYDYSYKYTSSDYSANDTATMSPFFAFDAELISSDNVNYFPTITIGDNGVLKKFENFKIEKNFNSFNKVDYNSSLFYDSLNDNKLTINFHFGETERSYVKGGSKKEYMPDEMVNEYDLQKKYEVVQSANFGDFYRFNLSNENFKKSLIGQLYNKYDFVNSSFSNATDKAKSVAENIFNYMFYLNNSSLTNIIKDNILIKFNNFKDSTYTEKNVLDFVNGSDNVDQTKNIIIDSNDDINGASGTGFNGRIGWIIKGNDSTKSSYTLGFNYSTASSSQFDVNKENQNKLLTSATFYVKNYEDFDLMQKSNNQYSYNGEKLSNRYFFNAYNQMLNDLTNFNSIQLSQTVMWQTGKKFKYVSAFYTKKVDGDTRGFWYYPDLMNVYSKTNDSSDFLKDSTFLISQGYATKNDMVLGKTYKISGDVSQSEDSSFKFCGTASDSLNIYPTIYDEDILPDMKDQAIIYMCNSDFRKLFGSDGGQKSNSEKISNDNYQDTSRTYLKYNKKNKKNMSEDILIYQLYLSNNFEKLKDNLDQITKYQKGTKDDSSYLETNNSSSSILSSKKTNLINLKATMFSKFSKAFIIISFSFSVIFVLVIMFVVYNILQKFLISQKTQLGNLKALGVRKSKLVFHFSAFMSVPLLLIVPIGWGLSIFLKSYILNVCSNYFNIPNIKNVGWKFLLLEWTALILVIISISLLISFLTIRKSPLNLLSENSEIKKVGWISRLSSKKKFKRFIPKMRLSVLSTSISHLILYSFVFFISILLLTTSLLIPGTIKKMSNSYYSNLNYENAYNYSGILSNVPTTRYSFFDSSFETNNPDKASSNKLRLNDELKSSSLNQFVKDSSTQSGFTSILNYENENTNYWQTNNLTNYFENQLISSILAFNGTSFSVGVINKLVENVNKINDSLKDRTTKYDVNTFLNTFASSILPNMFGQQEIDISGSNFRIDKKGKIDPSMNDENQDTIYGYCIKKIANNIVPSTIKQMWSLDNNEFNLFPINVGKIGFDQKTDEMTTQFKGYLGDDLTNQKEVSVLGIDPNAVNQNINLKNYSNFITYDGSDSKTIPVTISKKLELEKYKVGQTIPLYLNNNKMYIGDEINGTPILNDWWSYSDEDSASNSNISSLFSGDFDPTHLTYLVSSPEDSDSDPSHQQVYYYDEINNKYIPYKNIRNVILKIPVSTGRADIDNSIKEVNSAFEKIKNRTIKKDSTGKYYIIHPYDVSSYDSNGNEEDPVEMLMGGDTENIKYTWWSIAKNGLSDYKDANGNTVNASPILFTQSKIGKSEYSLKIVGVQNIYNDSDIFMNQILANKILGYENPEATIKVGSQKINIWSNFKLTKESEMSEQIRQILLNCKDGDTSIYGLSKTGINQAINSSIYLSKSKEVISNLVGSIYSILIVIILLIIVSVLVIISIISSISINQYKTYMVLMRIMGYRMKEINSILFWIFLPVTILSIAIPQIIIYFIITNGLPHLLIKFGIAVPVSLSYWTFFSAFVVGLFMFLAVYSYILFGIKKVKFSSLTN